MTAMSAYITTLMFALTQKFEDRQKGATAVEYGIMVAAIAAVIIAIVIVLGGQLNTIFADVSTKLEDIVP